MNRGIPGGFAARLAFFCQKRGAVFLLALPLAVAAALPDAGGKNIFLYFLFFLYGYLLMADDRFQAILDREKSVALLFGTLSISVLFVIWAGDIQFTKYSPGDFAYHFLRNFNSWFWVVAILGYGHRYLSFGNALLRYANEAAYPFYVLHQTVIVATGYYVVQLDLGVGAKFLVIAVTSFAVTVLLYDVAVKRANLTRFLFGMRRQVKARPGSQIA